jgi:hypothetical protein
VPHLGPAEGDPDRPIEATGPVDEVTIDVLAGRVEVAGVDQDRRPPVVPGVRPDLIDVGLRRVAAEGQDRDAQVAVPTLELLDDAVLLDAEV